MVAQPDVQDGAAQHQDPIQALDVPAGLRLEEGPLEAALEGLLGSKAAATRSRQAVCLLDLVLVALIADGSLYGILMAVLTDFGVMQFVSVSELQLHRLEPMLARVSSYHSTEAGIGLIIFIEEPLAIRFHLSSLFCFFCFIYLLLFKL